MVTERTGRPHRWEFERRFRRHALGWRSQPAILRIREAVSEIRRAARYDPVLGAAGAVTLLERVSRALEEVDSSSGAIGTAVNRAINELVPIIAGAPADPAARGRWLERLWAALQEDAIPYIEQLGDRWGELCALPEVASAWADELIGTTRMALSRDPDLHGFFPGTSACLSALYHAGRHQDLVDLLQPETFWYYRQWAVRALAAVGRKSEAIQLAEASRGPSTPDGDVDRLCEEILLSSGLIVEAYRRYGATANRHSTYLATFRAVARKYPGRTPREVLADLTETTPGEEGKWFAAARDARLVEEALELARTSPCDPRTLTRAARDWTEEHPEAAVEAGLLALHWLVKGYGYEVTGADVLAAYQHAMAAAERTGRTGEVRERLRRLLSDEGAGGFVTKILGPEVGR